MTVVADPRNSSEFPKVLLDGLNHGIGFDSMHVDQPKMAGPVPEGLSTSHPARKWGKSYSVRSIHVLSSF